MNPRASAAPRGRRRLRAHERRLVIFDAALRMFASKGYDGAAMEEIAAAAGVSKAVVYDHIRSKRELYVTALNGIRGDLVEMIEAELVAAEAGGEAQVRAAIDAILRFAQERPDAGRLLVRELHGADISEIGLELEDRITAGIAGALGDAPLLVEAAGRERQLEILAELLKSAILGIVSWWYRNPGVPREEIVGRAVDVVWPALERAARRR